ncbi:MAG: hypothetical protein IJ493_06230 [Clostridia bacterium]|nr:hypothetical protein [Clostridia bacterium]
MANFLKKAFSDMKESAKAQHEVDKANFAAAKAESKAQWEEAKAMGNPETAKKIMQEQRDAQIKEANERIAAAQKRTNDAKNR